MLGDMRTKHLCKIGRGCFQMQLLEFVFFHLTPSQSKTFINQNKTFAQFCIVFIPALLVLIPSSCNWHSCFPNYAKILLSQEHFAQFRADYLPCFRLFKFLLMSLHLLIAYAHFSPSLYCIFVIYFQSRQCQNIILNRVNKTLQRFEWSQ